MITSLVSLLAGPIVTYSRVSRDKYTRFLYNAPRDVTTTHLSSLGQSARVSSFQLSELLLRVYSAVLYAKSHSALLGNHARFAGMVVYTQLGRQTLSGKVIPGCVLP